MKLLLRAGLLATASVMFAGCGGGDSGGPSLTPGDGGPNTGADGEVISAGLAQGTGFNQEVIGTANNALELGDSSLLTVNLARLNTTTGAFTLIEEEASVSFSSNCSNSDQADITPATSTSDTGQFTATYTASGCSGDDLITATISYEGVSYSASTTITTNNFEVRFGNFVDGTFVEGVITDTPQTTLSAGDTAQLSVRFVDQDNAPFTGATDVFFSSTCINNGLSEIDPAIVTNNNGTILATYTARGCDGQDTVTATTSAGGNTLTATVDLTTEQPPLGALQFVSAEPEILQLKGTEGAVEISNDGRDIGPQSTVTFRVTSDNGEPLPNQRVDFELVTGDSGASNDGSDAYLSRYTDFTDIDGQVSTVVNPGTTATPLRVRATAERNNVDISAVSSRLVATTGIPDQDSFSLSVSTFNIDGWAYEGIETEITIRAADRFNNPVPNGTALVFWAEGASIEPSCVTQGGACSVTLTSQDPRPETGRVTVLARAIGEESFTDASPTNGRYDDGEVFDDLAEPYMDNNENCEYDANIEEFADFNNDNARNEANGLYDGLLCTKNGVNNNCNPNSETIFTSASTVIVLSGSTDLSVEAYLADDFSFDPATLCGGDEQNSGTRLNASTLGEVVMDCPQAITVAVEDARGQVPPAGTTMSVTSGLGELVGPTEYIMASTNSYGPWVESFFLNPADEGGDGVFEVTVATPNTEGGGVTTYTRLISVIQRSVGITLEQPETDDEFQIDSVDGGSFQLLVRELNELGLPAGTTISLSTTRGTIISDTTITLDEALLGNSRRQINIAPTGVAGFGFLTVTVTTPIADGCNAAKSYVSEFEFEEVVAEEEEAP